MKICKICGNEILKTGKYYCSNECKFNDKELNAKRQSNIKNPKDKLIKHVATGKTSTDILNKSGALGKYSRNVLGYELNWDDWEIIDKPKDTRPTIKCPYCNWTTIDVNNKSGMFTSHCKKKHGKSVTDIISNFPEFKPLYVMHNRESTRTSLINTESGGVECQICGDRLKTITNSHLKKHNMTQATYKELYGPIVSNKTSDKLSKLWHENIELQKNTWRSKPELELESYISRKNLEVIPNYRKLGTEFDLYIPIKNIAIEYNGLYWHKEGSGKHKNYHLDKTNLAIKNNIQLIHIFEDEWLNHKNIVLSRIDSMLGDVKTRIYARKCQIKLLNSKDSMQFLKLNHLQGSIGAKVHIGLYYNNELVSVMNFTKRKITGSNNPQWELLRFCNKINCSVIGGASKLLNYFIRCYSPEKIISYADRRYSNGNLYEQIGFTKISDGAPNYWYILDHKTRRHRFNFTKSNILQKFPTANKELTEYQNMLNLGYDRIWDCGSLKYEMNI